MFLIPESFVQDEWRDSKRHNGPFGDCQNGERRSDIKWIQVCEQRPGGSRSCHPRNSGFPSESFVAKTIYVPGMYVHYNEFGQQNLWFKISVH